MSSAGWQDVRIDELDRFPVAQGLEWRPIRRRFGIRAFGCNAYTSKSVGGQVVEEHSESRLGHEELYLVVSGHARFTLDGEEVDAPAGTIVYLRDPNVRRGAVSEEEDGLQAKRGTGRCSTTWPVSRRCHESPGRRSPEARARSARTGSASGRATTSTAP